MHAALACALCSTIGAKNFSMMFVFRILILLEFGYRCGFPHFSTLKPVYKIIKKYLNLNSLNFIAYSRQDYCISLYI